MKLHRLARLLPNPVSIVLVQFYAILADKNDNLQRAIKAIDNSARRGIHVAVLPELWTTGYLAGRKFRELAETIPGPTTRQMARLAKTHHIHLVLGSIPEKVGEQIYNTAIVIDPRGRIILKHRKVHLWRDYERQYFTAGGRYKVTNTAFGKIGLAICHDIDFPEVPRILALEGAEIIFNPSAYPSPFERDWDLILPASARQNHAFLVSVNRTGDEEGRFATSHYPKGVHFFGKSKVISPSGEILLEMPADSKKTAIGIVQIDLGEVRRQRNSDDSFLAERRPETYRILHMKRFK